MESVAPCKVKASSSSSSSFKDKKEEEEGEEAAGIPRDVIAGAQAGGFYCSLSLFSRGEKKKISKKSNVDALDIHFAV